MKINKITGVGIICSLLWCMAGRAQGVSETEDTELPANSYEEQDTYVDMGLYHTSKKGMTGSVATASGKDLTSPVPYLFLAMPGQLAGLQWRQTSADPFDPSGLMRIRGVSTVNSSNMLVVVDGVFSPFPAYEILTGEIESISILKDGSASAVYGQSGGNGVMVITTKRGYEGPTKANVWYYSSLQQSTRRPQFINSAEYAQLRNEAAANSGIDPQYSQYQIDAFADAENPLYPNNNWYDMLVQKFRPMQQAGVSVRGGNDRTKFYSHINYTHLSSPFIIADEPERDYDPTMKADRANIRVNYDMKFNNYLSAFLLMNGSIDVSKHGTRGYQEIYRKILSTPPVMYGPLTPEVMDDMGEITAGSNQVVTYLGEDDPPYGRLNRGGYTQNLRPTVSAQTGVKFDLGFLTDGLSLSGVMAYRMYGTTMTYNLKEYERYMRTSNYMNLQFNKWGSANNTPLSYSKSANFFYNLNLSARADYLKTFDNHSVQAAAFYYFSKEEMEEFSTFPYLNIITGMTAQYGYRSKYFVKADLGYSGSDQFHPDSRFMITPAISAAWIATNEDFLTGVDWLNLLKLRASYGVNANSQLGGVRYEYADDIRSDGSEGMRGNSRLSAEKIKKQNYGIDLELFDAFSLSVDYFYHRCDNLLVSNGMIPIFQTIPLSNFPRLNNGQMENRGIEIEAGYNSRLTQDISVFANAGFSFARNKIISVNEFPKSDYYYPYRTEGYAQGQRWGYRIDYSNGNGMFNTQQELDALTYSGLQAPRLGDFMYSDLNNDGIIDECDRAPIGFSAMPEIMFNLRGGLQWKSFDLCFLLQGVTNYSITVSGAGVYENTAQGVFSDLHRHAWTPERYAAGEKIEYPALSLTNSSNHVANSFFIMDGSYLKLRNLEIGFSLPTSVARKITAENIRFSLSGQNLFTFDRMRSKYIDPEIGTMENFQPFRVYSLGIQCTF